VFETQLVAWVVANWELKGQVKNWFGSCLLALIRLWRSCFVFHPLLGRVRESEPKLAMFFWFGE